MDKVVYVLRNLCNLVFVYKFVRNPLWILSLYYVSCLVWKVVCYCFCSVGMYVTF
jgi:hypothetical protein